jgi:elongation factor P hydroxylase
VIDPELKGAGPDASTLSALFDALFLPGYRTALRGGGNEPLYLPATQTAPAQVIFTRDYAASALHEAAHWCLAGPRRRQLVDYGYWYVPPPRSPAQQQQFFHHEVRVQALESVFAEAAGMRFRVSIDDPGSAHDGELAFADAVAAEAARLRARGLPVRAQWFHDALVAISKDRS